MKKVKFVFLIVLSTVLTLCLLFVLSAFYIKQQYDNRPVNQPMTKWVSENQTISFETDACGAGYGTLEIGDSVIDIWFATGAGRAIDIYHVNKDGSTQLIERWQGYFGEEDKFVAIVADKTTYFSQGDRIVFHKIGE